MRTKITPEQAREMLWKDVRLAVIDTETLIERDGLAPDLLVEVEAAITSVERGYAKTAPLAPADRRTRRLQYRAIDAAGLAGESSGDEPDRFVTIRRRTLADPPATARSGPGRWRLIEVAVATARGGKVETPVWSALVNPGVPVDTATMKIHRISDDLLAQAPGFGAVAPDLEALLTPAPGERLVVVAWNAGFDIGGVLRPEFELLGRSLPDLPLLDPRRGLTRKAGITNAPTLGDLLNALGINNPAAHRAGGDGWATAAATCALLDRMADRGWTDIEPLLASCGDLRTGGIKAVRTPPRETASVVVVPIPDKHLDAHDPAVCPTTRARLVRVIDDCARLCCSDLALTVNSLVRTSPLPVREVWDGLREVLRLRVAANDGPGANAVLGALAVGLLEIWCPMPPPPGLTRYEIRRKDGISLWHEVEATVARLAPCRWPLDACPDCRAQRPCPRDEFVRAVAAPVLDARWSAKGKIGLRETWLNWLRPDGYRGGWLSHRHTVLNPLTPPPAGPRLADAATALLLRSWSRFGEKEPTRPEVELPDVIRRGCADPLVWEMWVFYLARGGREADLEAAIAAADAALAAQPRGYADSGWASLRATRDIVAARQRRFLPSTRINPKKNRVESAGIRNPVGERARRSRPMRFVSAPPIVRAPEVVVPADPAPPEVTEAVVATISRMSGHGGKLVGPTAAMTEAARLVGIRGRRWPGTGVRVYGEAVRAAVETVAIICDSDPTRVNAVAGWALDPGPDGGWFPHVWAWDRVKEQLIEPTDVPRSLYIGALLAEDERGLLAPFGSAPAPDELDG